MTALTRFSWMLPALALVAITPALARAQQGTPAPAIPSSAATPKPRRTVEIRAQAPAPEVITVRPREVPQYTRRLLASTLVPFPDSTGAARASVVVPAPASAEARAAATPDRRIRTP